jgi:hypothetical protein
MQAEAPPDRRWHRAAGVAKLPGLAATASAGAGGRGGPERACIVWSVGSERAGHTNVAVAGAVDRGRLGIRVGHGWRLPAPFVQATVIERAAAAV